jgi:MYXO-CTERM domain-containing protein
VSESHTRRVWFLAPSAALAFAGAAQAGFLLTAGTPEPASGWHPDISPAWPALAAARGAWESPELPGAPLPPSVPAFGAIPPPDGFGAFGDWPGPSGGPGGPSLPVGLPNQGGFTVRHFIEPNSAPSDAPAPAPPTLALAAAGLVVLALRRRR